MVKQGPSNKVATSSVSDKLSEAINRAIGTLERSPEEMQAAIVERILTAGSLDEVFAESSAMSADDVLGLPHDVMSVEYGKSRFEDGPPAFAIVTGKFDNGTTNVYTNGSVTCIAQLLRAAEDLPIRLVLKRKDTPTQSGYYPAYYTKA